MTKKRSTEIARPQANHHEQYWLFTVLAIVIPLIGFILGIVYLTHKDVTERKLGEHTLSFSILFGLLWAVLFVIWQPLKLTPVGVPYIDNSSVLESSDVPVPTNPSGTLGSTLNIDGNTDVTIHDIIDPATPAYPYLDAAAGKRYVAVKLQIKNMGNSTLTGNANGDLTAVESSNQSAALAFTEVSNCTNFASGQYTLSPNSSVTGCVFFEVPTDATISAVQFNSHGGFSGQTGEWLIK